MEKTSEFVQRFPTFFTLMAFYCKYTPFIFEKIFWLIWFVFYFYSILTNKKLDNRDSNYRREFDFRDKLDSAFGQSLSDSNKRKLQIIWYITHFYTTLLKLIAQFSGVRTWYLKLEFTAWISARNLINLALRSTQTCIKFPCLEFS